MGDKAEFAVCANVVEDKAFRRGAKVVVVHREGGNERVFCEGLTKAGRTIRKWISLKNLRNFRTTFIHEKRRIEAFGRYAIPTYSKERAKSLAERCAAGGLDKEE